MTDSWTITHADDSTALGCERVNDWLREHNWTANPDFMARIHEPEHEAEPLVLLVKTDSSTIGGLFAQTQLSWLRISVMAVHPGHRGLGIGAALLGEAEREATSRGCKYAHVDTMDYQARISMRPMATRLSPRFPIGIPTVIPSSICSSIWFEKR